jgi:hypothetical protein
MSTYFCILTSVGAAKLANATALGQTLEFSQMALGHGGGSLPVPNQSQVALIGEVRRAPLNSVEIDPDNPTWIVCEQVIPAETGGWTIRETGIYDTDGDLIAVGNFPETYKPVLEEGSGRTQTIRMVIQVSNAATVTLKIDPSVVLATREYVDLKDTAHAEAADPHPQYLKRGVTGSDLGSTIYGLRSVIKTEDFFVNRDPGVYKVQNDTTTPNPNRPPVMIWGSSQLFGILKVDRCEFGGEDRMVQVFTSTEGEIFISRSGGGVFSDWVDITGRPHRSFTLSVNAASTASSVILESSVGYLKVKYFTELDEFKFIVAETNTGGLTVKIDSQAAIQIKNVVASTQLIKGALATIRYMSGEFYLVEQIDPKTGTSVDKIGVKISDTLDVSRISSVPAANTILSREAYSILFELVQASSNWIDQTIKDSSFETYRGFYGSGDGETTFTAPDWTDMHDRSTGPFRDIGTYQSDAMQNITGQWGQFTSGLGRTEPGTQTGAFVGTDPSYFQNSVISDGTSPGYAGMISFDASRVVRTADENRVVTLATITRIGI